MKLVILGAGASFDNINYYYGQSPDLSWRPPLANEIFDARTEFRTILFAHPGAKALLSELNNTEDVEDFFQSKWNFVQNHKADELLANLVNIQYYLSQLFYQMTLMNANIGNSNLDVLTSHAYEYSIAKKEDVAFVTFNYDLLLEQSFSKIYFSKEKPHFSKIDEYINYPLKIFKLHGSCNWFSALKFNPIEIGTLNIADYLYNTKTSYATINKFKDNKIQVLENANLRFNQREKHFYFPELLVPFKDKDDFILPSDHLQKLKELLPKVTEVLIIGWKGTEDAFKRLINTHIGDRNIKVMCVCGTKSKKHEESMRLLFPNSNVRYFEDNYILQKIDNTDVEFSNSTSKKLNFHHDQGTFSAYTLNVIRKQFQDFFEI